MPDIPAEPVIIINGHRLTHAQAMTLRVAITSFNSEMCEGNALGSDETGEAIRQGYLRNSREILHLMGLV